MHLLGLGSPAVSTSLVVSPAGAERMGNVELVQESAREVPHQPCKRGLAAVKGRHEGHDAGPGLGRCLHVVDMDQGKGRFPGHQYERSPFLQAYVCGPVDEIAAIAAGNGCQRTHGAGADDHAIVLPGTAGRACGQIPRLMACGCQAAQRFGAHLAFRLQHPAGLGGDDQMAFQVWDAGKGGQHGFCQRHAAGAAYAENDSVSHI